MLTRRFFTRAALAAPFALASASALASPAQRPPQVGDEVEPTPEAWWALPIGTLVSVEYKLVRRWYLTNGQRGAYVGTIRLPHNGVVHGGVYEPWIVPEWEKYPPLGHVIRALGLPYIPHDKEADAAVAQAIAPFVNPDDPHLKQGVAIVHQPRMTWTLRDTDPNAIVAGFNKARIAADPIRRALTMVRR